MAKMSLTAYMNQELKLKGLGVKEAKKNAGKYKSISSAKKAGSLYYTDKKGNVMAAVYAEDLNKKPVAAATPKESKITKSNLDAKGDSRPGFDKFKKDQKSRDISIADNLKKVRKKTNAASTETRNDVMAQGSFNNLTRDQQRLVQNKVNNGMTRNNAIAKVTADITLNKNNQVTKGNNKGGMMMKKKTGYAAGGMPMVMKAGKKVPAFAADGVGKMNKGGAVKKKPTAKMMAGGMAAKKKKPAAKMMGGGMTKSSGYMYGGMAKKKTAAKKK